MIHAFVHYHSGRTDLADAAWHTSGAAMMQLTKFVSMYSKRRAAPVVSQMPSLAVEYETDKALQSDSEIAGRCATLAGEAADNSDVDGVKQYCRTLHEYYADLVKFEAGSAHPAIDLNPPAFSSFEATLRKFVLVRKTD